MNAAILINVTDDINCMQISVFFNFKLRFELAKEFLIAIAGLKDVT